MDAYVSGSTIIVTVSKQSGTFNSSGTMYLKVGTYEPFGVDRASRSLSAGSASVQFSHNLDDHTGYPKNYYARYQSSNGGYAWVGPIEVSFVNGSPGAPTISSVPSSATVNEPVSVRVYRGTDPDGDPVKVQCTATSSNRTDANPYASGFAEGGNSALPSFIFSSTGTKTIYCTTFDIYGAGSPTASRTISVVVPNRPPGQPTIASSPAEATLDETVFVTVWRGTDPDGDDVKVECTANGSDRTDSNPFKSGFGTGGSSLSVSFRFGQLGTQTIYCTSFDRDGLPSATVSRSIQVVEPQPSVGSVTLSPGTVVEGDQQTVSWQSQHQNWYLLQLFDAAGAQPVDTSAFLSTSCQALGAGAGAQGCLLQANPSSAQSASWAVPAALAAGDYRIKVAVWYSDGSSAGAFSSPFSVQEPDTGTEYVNVSPWAQEAAAYLVGQDVVDDPPDHDLRGTSDANRAEVATLLYRSLGGGRDQADDAFAGWYGTTPPVFFADVADPDVWYFKPVTFLGDLAFDDAVTVFDQAACVFRPARPISRGWLTKALLEAWNQAPLTSFSGVSLFDDVPASHPAAGYVYRARQLGVIDGTDNLFRPDEPADRQDLFVMLHRVLDATTNPVAPVPLPTPEAADFARSRSCSGIGHRFEQPVLLGAHPPQVAISTAGLRVETVGDLSGVYVADLEAVISDLDPGSYLDSEGTLRTANPFCAWFADRGVFVDQTPAGGAPYCKVRWIAPTDVSGADGVPMVVEITLFVGDGLGHEISDQATLTLSAPSSDPTAPSVSMDPLPAEALGNQVLEVVGDVHDNGDSQSASFGVLAVLMSVSTDGGTTWRSAGEAEIQTSGRWLYQWPTLGSTGAVVLRAEAVNLRGNRRTVSRSTTVRLPFAIAGVVIDSYAEVVENALVELTGGGLELGVRSDSSGAFRFTEYQHGLQAGSGYRLAASLGGRETALDGLVLDAAEPALSETLILDTAPPFTLPSVPGGHHDLPVAVALECSDDRSGCAATYFTTDGSQPSESSAPYSTPLQVDGDTTLRFFSLDQAGNAEAVQTETYSIGSSSGATGLILEPVGEQTGNVTVSADASDPDGLATVSVTFVGGGSLTLCDAATQPCSAGGPFVDAAVDPSAYGIVDAGSVLLELWVEDVLGNRTLVDTQAFLWSPGSAASTFSLTVTKAGSGDGTVSGGGIDCPPGCATATSNLAEGTPVTLTGSGEQFAGFAGERCYGTAPCSFDMDQDLVVEAGFVLPDALQVLYSSPGNGDTGVGVSTQPRLHFNQDVYAGPDLQAITLRTVDGVAVPFSPVLRSQDRYLSLVTESALERGQQYVVEVPATAVVSAAGSPLAASYGFSFTCEQPGEPKMHLAAYPVQILEGGRATVSIWFEQTVSHDRTLALTSGPNNQLLHPSEVVLPAGEALVELEIDTWNNAALTDFVETLQATELGEGTQQSVQITVVDSTEVTGSYLRWAASTVFNDEDGDGVFEAGETADIRFEVVNQGSSGISNVALDFEVGTGTYNLRFLGGAPFRCDIGYLDPSETGSCTETLLADDELPTGAYQVKVHGTSSQNEIRDLARVAVVNTSQPDFVINAGVITSHELEPGSVITMTVSPRNAGDGFSPELPLIEVLMEVDGEELVLYRTFANVRGDIWHQQDFRFSITAPDVPGEHPIRARINPADDPEWPQIPESDTTNNQSVDRILHVAAPNQAPVFDPLPETLRIAVGSLLSFTVSATDPDNDPLIYSLAPGAPVGMTIDPGSGLITWTPACGQGPNSYGVEVLVADPDGASDSHLLTVVVGVQADLQVTKTASTSSALPGETVGFTIVVANLGPSCTSATVSDTFDAALTDVAWTCTASTGSLCTGSGTGDLLDGGVSLFRDGTVTYDVAARILDGASGVVLNEASAAVSAGAVDPVPGNDADTAAVTLRDLDFGDAGDATVNAAWTYSTSLADDGARHGLGSGPRLGALVDGEDDGQPSLLADGDDLAGADDEDGVVFKTPLTPCETAEIEVTASSPGLLSAWIDFGRDGGWSEVEDAVLADEPLAAGTTALTISVPCAAVNGGSFARFRLSSAGGLGTGGLAADGEVEDYGVSIEQVLHTLTVTLSGSGSGVVTSASEGIECGLDCEEDYYAGTDVTLSATPDSASEFVGWSGAGCSVGSCQVTMDGDKTVSATFDLVEPCYQLTLTKEGQGADLTAAPGSSVECLTGQYHAGELIQLTAQPTAGWVVGGWSGTGEDASTDSMNDLIMPAFDHSASVVYVESTAPTVLLVDDDNDDPDVRALYEGALNASHVTYDVWSTDHSDIEPELATLGLYPKVIWFTGAAFRHSVGPGASAEVALAAYLDAGGCLLLSSQDYLIDRGETPFMSTYLGLGSSIDDARHDLVVGQGSVFGGLGPYPLSFPVGETLENYSDVVSPDGSAEVAFLGDGGEAAIDKLGTSYRTVFLAFPFEALAPEARLQVLRTALNLCELDCPGPFHVTLEDHLVTGVEVQVSCDRLYVGQGYQVLSGGELTLRAPGTVVFSDGFAVEQGGKLRVVIEKPEGTTPP